MQAAYESMVGAHDAPLSRGKLVEMLTEDLYVTSQGAKKTHRRVIYDWNTLAEESTQNPGIDTYPNLKDSSCTNGW